MAPSGAAAGHATRSAASEPAAGVQSAANISAPRLAWSCAVRPRNSAWPSSSACPDSAETWSGNPPDLEHCPAGRTRWRVLRPQPSAGSPVCRLRSWARRTRRPDERLHCSQSRRSKASLRPSHFGISRRASPPVYTLEIQSASLQRTGVVPIRCIPGPAGDRPRQR